MAPNYHVTPEGDGWDVQKEGGQRASSHHETQAAAVAAARGYLNNSSAGGELNTHGRDGGIRAKDTINRKDPHPPKG
jgi:hypothetical protein